MDEVNEVIIKRKPAHQQVSFERLQFICYFVAGMVSEVFGLLIVILFMLCSFGVLK